MNLATLPTKLLSWWLCMVAASLAWVVAHRLGDTTMPAPQPEGQYVRSSRTTGGAVVCQCMKKPVEFSVAYVEAGLGAAFLHACKTLSCRHRHRLCMLSAKPRINMSYHKYTYREYPRKHPVDSVALIRSRLYSLRESAGELRQTCEFSLLN